MELRYQSVAINLGLGYQGFMPRFRENGRVRISDTSNGKVLDIVVRFFTIHVTPPVSEPWLSEQGKAKNFYQLMEAETVRGMCVGG